MAVYTKAFAAVDTDCGFRLVEQVVNRENAQAKNFYQPEDFAAYDTVLWNLEGGAASGYLKLPDARFTRHYQYPNAAL